MVIKKIILSTFILFVLFFLMTLRVNAQKLTTEQYKQDLEILKKELPKRHKSLFAKTSEIKFNNKVDDIVKKSESLNNEKFEIELYKLIKEINDEHTKIEPIYDSIFPLKFDFFREGMFVTSTDEKNSDLFLKRLDGIEKISFNELLNSFKKLVRTENESYFEVFFQNFINNPRIIKGLDISTSNRTSNFILDNVKYPINAILKNSFSPKLKRTVLRNENSNNYWYKLIHNNEIIYFNYQNCAEQKNMPFKTFNNNLFEVIQDKKPKKMIIDLRNNSGGNSAIIKPFLDQLSKSYLNKKGALYVLIGKRTFSSALMNAVNLKRGYNSILIGQATSGNVNHYGETRGFRLPNSKIIVGYSTKYWEIWNGYKGSLKPDVKIEYSIQNFKKNIDEAIEYVKKQ